jgi:hypothetical protein
LPSTSSKPSSTNSSKRSASGSPTSQALELLEQLHKTPKLNWISVLSSALKRANSQGRKQERRFMVIMLQEEASTKWNTPTQRRVASQFLATYTEHLKADDN